MLHRRRRKNHRYLRHAVKEPRTAQYDAEKKELTWASKVTSRIDHFSFSSFTDPLLAAHFFPNSVYAPWDR